jgi:hypothetical protein
LYKLDETVKIKIEHEIFRIEKLITEAKPLLDLCKIREPDFIEITAAAQILHSFYNGVESVIIIFFKSLDEKLPNDTHWHKTLFEMAFGNNSKNVKIFDDDKKEKLVEYLSYRHFIRHSYSSELKWNEMAPLVNELDEIWKKVKIDFSNFISNN